MRKTTKKKKIVKEKWSDKNSKKIDTSESCTSNSTESSVSKDDDDAESNITVNKNEKDLPRPFIFPKESLNLSDRPIRAAAATAQAISEAQQEFLEIEPPPEFKRNKHGQIEVLVDKPVKPRKYIKRAKAVTQDLNPECNDKEATVYCEETMQQNVEDLVETFKNQYLSMVHRMQTPIFIKNVEHQLKKEKHRRDQLAKRVGQLQAQVETLVQESLEMLKYSLKELGIDAISPPEFIEKAKEIVCTHNELQKKKLKLEHEVSKLQEEQEMLMKEKEKQLYGSLTKAKSSINITDQDMVRFVQNEINNCVQQESTKLSENKPLDVTLTKVDDIEASAYPDDNNNDHDNDPFTLSKVTKHEETFQKPAFHETEQNVSSNANEFECKVDNIISYELSSGVLNSIGETSINWQRNKSFDYFNTLPSRFIEPPNFNLAVMNHINKEIERSMRRSDIINLPTTSTSAPYLHSSNKWPVTSSQCSSDLFSSTNSSSTSAITNQMSSMDSVSRLAKIIEDSVRGTQDETQKKVNNNNNNTTKFTNNKCKTKIAAVKNEDFGMEGLASRLETCVSREKHDINFTGEKSNKRKLDERNEIVLNSGPERNTVGGNPPRDETLQWQQEITTGFDRLVALASEVDKRRRSDDAPPVKMVAVIPKDQQQHDHGSRGHPGGHNDQSSREPGGHHDQSSRQPGGEHDQSSRQPGGQHDHGSRGQPGDKLPERHFKKKYFDQEFQKRQQQNQFK